MMIAILKKQKDLIINKIVTVFGHEPWWVEFWSGITALAWCYVSQLSGDKVYHHEIFSELSIVAAAEFWQACAVILGGFQVLSLLYNDYRIRWIMCFFASWFWAFLTLAIASSDPHPPGLALYASYACINLMSMIKLSRTYV